MIGSQGVAPQTEDSLAEMMVGYEKRIAEMLMTIQKQERDMLYKDEEIKAVKNIARDCAEQLEPVKKREEEFNRVIADKERLLQDEKIDKEKLVLEIQQLKDTLS